METKEKEPQKIIPQEVGEKSGKAIPEEYAETYSTENTVQAEEWGKTTQKGGDGTKRYGEESKAEPEKGGNVEYADNGHSK